jgi:hypothetical protein
MTRCIQPDFQLDYKGDTKMNHVHRAYKVLSVVVISLSFVSLAHATVLLRAWVSNAAGATDANACTRTAPCLTFTGALAKVAPGGEIDVLDPGDYGPATITHSITIDGTQGGGFAGVILTSGTAITVNTMATTDVVTLRNLSINGQNTAATGIAILNAGTVHIENCVISGSGTDGIVDVRSGSVNSVFYLYIKDTITKNNGAGIALVPGTNVFLIASLSNVRVQDNAGIGIDFESGVYASLDHCVLSGNRGDGLFVKGNSGGVEGTASAASAHVEDTNSSNNGTSTGAGFHAGNGGFIRLSTSTAYDNTTGLQIDAGGKIFSYGTNRISGNTNGNGPPSSTIALQ